MNDNLRALLTGVMIFLVGGLFADNLSVGSVLLTPGQSKVVTIQLNNQTASYTAFQFDVVLPDGVQVVKSVGDDLLSSLNVERISNHELHAAKIKSNIYRFLAFSMTNADFSGRNGALLHITLSADKDMNNVNESLKIMSQEFVEADGTLHILEDQTFPISVFSGELTPITIGKSGKASYCGDKSLDFSYSDEVKAYIATGFDKDEGIIWLTRVKDVPAGVPVLIKGEAGKTYDVPVTDSENSYYTNMFVGNTSGAKIQISETSDDGSKTNYYLKDGTFMSVTGNATIGNNKCYLQLPSTFKAAEVGTLQTVTIKESGKASFAAPADMDFTDVEGLKAFTATGYDKSTKTIWLTRVMKVQKGEGVLLKGDPQDYEIPSFAVQSHYENMFVGNTSGASIKVYETSADGSQTNFYLKGGAFLSVTGNATIGNNKCYLALPSSMVSAAASTRGEASYLLDEPEVIKLPILFRSLGNDGDGTTGIEEVKSGEVKGEKWFSIQGQRVDNPGKGIYISNGRKVVIK